MPAGGSGGGAEGGCGGGVTCRRERSVTSSELSERRRWCSDAASFDDDVSVKRETLELVIEVIASDRRPRTA